MSERLTVQYSILASEMDVEIKRLLTNSLTRLSKLDQSFGEDLPYALGHVNDGETNKLLTAITLETNWQRLITVSMSVHRLHMVIMNILSKNKRHRRPHRHQR